MAQVEIIKITNIIYPVEEPVKNSKNNNNTPKKGACKNLGNNIFDCISRKNIDVYTKTLKQIVIHIGTEFVNCTDQMKYIIENLANLDLRKPNFF